MRAQDLYSEFLGISAVALGHIECVQQ